LTVKLPVPFPAPEDDVVIQGLCLTAIHLQPGCVVTAKSRVPPLQPVVTVGGVTL